MKDKNIKGIWPALMIPVDKDGAPDYLELEKFVSALSDDKVDGLYILGSTGQGFLFTEEQRNFITKKILELTKGQIPVIVQVGALNTKESIRLAEKAQNQGAYGISSVSPIYYKLNTDLIFKHYNAIGSSVDIPFFPYHIGNESVFTNGNAEAYVDKIMGIPNIKGMKITTQNLYEIALINRLSKNKLLLFSGADELMCQAAMCGTVGAIGSFYNLWGKECRKIRNEFLSGNVEVATEFMLKFQEVIYQVLPNVWSFFNQAIKLKYDVNIGLPNLPLGFNQSKWEESEIIRLMRKVEETLEGSKIE